MGHYFHCVKNVATVTVDGISSYTCPAQITENIFGITYSIILNGDSVTARRQGNYNNINKCKHLSFKCCKGMFLIFKFSIVKYYLQHRMVLKNLTLCYFICLESCEDGIQNNGESGVDCGGQFCPSCGKHLQN